MKYLFLSLWILFVSSNCYAQKVTEIEAQKAAQFAHQQMKSGMESKTNTPIVLCSEKGNDTLLYVFPYEKDGFAIISANKAAPPLLGFSETGSFNQSEIPAGLAYLLKKYKYNIQEIIKNKTTARAENKTRWNNYLNDIELKSVSSSVTPLVHTSWGQSGGYALYTPNNSQAGCTAVAMAQILWYWATETCCIEPSGTMSHDGLFVNFGATTYNWGDMNPSYADEDNALLIYHAGVSCKTNYNKGSSTPGKARNGFVNHWGISPNADVKR